MAERVVFTSGKSANLKKGGRQKVMKQIAKIISPLK